MPYYVYLKSDGKAISPKHTISPQDVEALSDTFFQVSEPMSNPIFDNGEFREKTVEELELEVAATKLARTEFTQDEIRRAFQVLDRESDLDAIIISNEKFSTYWDLANQIDLTHPLTVQALTNFTATEIEAIKMEI